MTLRDLKLGESAVIRSVGGEGALSTTMVRKVTIVQHNRYMIFAVAYDSNL